MKFRLLQIFPILILVCLMVVPVYAIDIPYNWSLPSPCTDSLSCFFDVAGVHTVGGADGFGAPGIAIGVGSDDFTGKKVSSVSFYVTAVVAFPSGTASSCTTATFSDTSSVIVGTIDKSTNAVIQTIGTITFSAIPARLCTFGIGATAGSPNNVPTRVTVTGSATVGTNQFIGIRFNSGGEASGNHYVAVFCGAACNGTQLTGSNSGIYAFNCAGATPCSVKNTLAGQINFVPVIQTLCSTETNGAIIGAEAILVVMAFIAMKVLQEANAGRISEAESKAYLQMIVVIGVAVLIVTILASVSSAGGPC